MAKVSLPGTLRPNSSLQVILTLMIGAVGATIAAFGGLPAATLIGSTIAVSLCSFCRVPTFIPASLRNLAFAAIGCSLGSGINSDFLDLAVKWPISLVGLLLVMGAIMLATTYILTRFFGQSRETSFLAGSPGALSYSLAIAAEGVGDARAIVVIQSIRLLLITTGLPLVLDLLNLEHGTGTRAGTAGISWPGTIGLFAATLIAGYLLTRKRLPAAYLIAGVLLSAALHVSGAVTGRPQPPVLLIGFLITGAVVGARFTRIPFSDIRRLLLAAFAVMLVATGIAALFAVATASILNIPFGQVWVSYAPGGVEAMAAMALALGYDTGFVAAHHLFRIIFLLLLLPALLRFFTGSKQQPAIDR